MSTDSSPSTGRLILAPAIVSLGLTLLALVAVPVLGFAASALGIGQRSVATLGLIVAGSVVGLLVGLRAWPEVGRTLLAYAFAARVPVAIVMLAAILGSWGTHHDVPPDAQFPAMSPLAKWVTIGLVPQMTVWIWYTVVLGSLFAIPAGVLASRRRGSA